LTIGVFVGTISPMKTSNKVEWVKFRISKDDKRLIKAGAKADGLTMSSWLLLLGKNRCKEIGVTLKNIDHPNQIKMPLT